MINLVTGYLGTEHVTAADFGSFNASLFGTGEIVLDIGSKLAIQVISNNQIRISDGDIVMQGRHIRINTGTYEDLTIDNGSQGMKRNDLIVVEYSKDSSTGIESAQLKVVKGTPGATAVTPIPAKGNIFEGETLNQMPLYIIPIDGLNVGTPIQQFTVMGLQAQNADTLDGKHANEFATIEQYNALNEYAGAIDTKATQIQTTANNAMPKSGGYFNGDSFAVKSSIVNARIMNTAVANSGGTWQGNTHFILFQRK